jgi:putative DNA primase/helicase
MDTRLLDEAIARACAMWRAHPILVPNAARDYIRRGFRPVPLPLTVKSKGKDPDAGKGCYLSGWPRLRITETQVEQYFSGPVNVGVVVGNGLVDVDLDCPEALDLSDKYLSLTNSVFGRASKPRSHREYQYDGVAPTRTFRDPITGDMIVELRGDMKDGRPGAQTVFPPSIHVKSGERIAWAEDGEPARVAYTDLHRSVMKLAVAVLFARYIPNVAPDDDAQFQQVLAKTDPRISNRIAEWQRELNGARSAKTAPSPQQPSPEEPPTVGQPTEHEVTRLYTALTYINSSDRNERWLPIGGAIYDLPWPEDLRRAFWDWWSWHMDPAPENAKKFDEGDQDKTWASFARDYQGNRATVGSIFHHALENGWDGHTLKSLPDEIKALVPPPVELPNAGMTPQEWAEIDRLARLPTWQYGKQRKEAAKNFGIRLDHLDAVVEQARRRIYGDEEADNLQGHALKLDEADPWPEPVDGHELVRDLGRAVRRYVVMEPIQVFTVALWIIHTYIFDVFICTPRLAIGSPEMRCGKTTLLKVLRCLVWRPLPTVSITAPALFRTTEKYRPTALFDEGDRTFNAKHGAAADAADAILAVLNSGYQPGDYAVRTDGENHEPRLFALHCPAALALIGKLPDTLADRSLRIWLKRKHRGERSAKFSLGHIEHLQTLARKIRRWCNDNVEQVTAITTAQIESEHESGELFNRTEDKWRALLAIAEATGWLPHARFVAVEAARQEGEVEEADDASAVPLLADIKRVFDDQKTDRLRSEKLVGELIAMNDRPWRDFRRGLGVTQAWVAKTLSTYDIHPEPRAIRFDDGLEARGYLRERFEDAWTRYLSQAQA